MSNPVPSDQIVDFKSNAEDVDQFVAGTANTFVNRLGVSRFTINGILAQADIALDQINADVATVDSAKDSAVQSIGADANTVQDEKNKAITLISQAESSVQSGLDNAINRIEQDGQDAAASTGWFVVGEFADGFTYTGYNQVGRDADGQLWSYNGSLPFIVTAGTVPSEPDYTNRGDAAVRQEFQRGQLRSTNYTTSRVVRKSGLNAHSVSLTVEKKRPVVSFIDDDGAKSYMTKFKPLFDAKGFKAAVAIYTERTNDPGSTGMDWDDIRQLNDEGYEVLSHTHTNANLGQITPTEAEYEFQQSRFEIESRGIPVESFVPVQGAVTEQALPLIRKYFRASFRTRNDGIQLVPLQDYDVSRRDMVSSDEQDNPTLQELTSLVDYAIANDEWVVFTSHADYDGATPEQMQVVSDLLDYIESNNVAVRTPSEALDIHGSKINIGDDRDPFAADSPDFFKVTADGEMFPRKVRNVKNPGGITFDTPIDYFEANCLTIFTTASGSPFGVGTVETYRGTLASESIGWQRRIIEGDRVYYRTWSRARTEWNGWVEVQSQLPLYLDQVSDASVPITDYPENLITHGFTRTGAAGLPDVALGDGLLMIARSRGAGGTYEGFQIWTPSNSSLLKQKWMRNWDRVGGEWGDWFRVDNQIQAYDDSDFGLSPTSQSMLIGMKSYTTSQATASGFAPGAGTVYSFRGEGPSSIYGAMQLYVPLRSNSIQMRHWDDTSDQWSDFEPVCGGATGTFTTSDSKTVTVVNGLITEIS